MLRLLCIDQGIGGCGKSEMRLDHVIGAFIMPLCRECGCCRGFYMESRNTSDACHYHSGVSERENENDWVVGKETSTSTSSVNSGRIVSFSCIAWDQFLIV